MPKEVFVLEIQALPTCFVDPSHFQVAYHKRWMLWSSWLAHLHHHWQVWASQLEWDSRYRLGCIHSHCEMVLLRRLWHLFYENTLLGKKGSIVKVYIPSSSTTSCLCFCLPLGLAIRILNLGSIPSIHPSVPEVTKKFGVAFHRDCLLYSMQLDYNISLPHKTLGNLPCKQKCAILENLSITTNILLPPHWVCRRRHTICKVPYLNCTISLINCHVSQLSGFRARASLF